MTVKCVLWVSDTTTGKVKDHNKQHAIAHETDHFHVYAHDNIITAMIGLCIASSESDHLKLVG